MSITSLLFTARDSLLANQMAIDITGANVANVNTPGYTRQRTNFESLGNVDVGNASAQVGVIVNRIERMYDRYIESQVIDQRQSSGYSDAMMLGLQNIEIILDDTSGGGINEHLNRFWSSWEDLSRNPAGKLERSALLSSAETLTGAIVSYKRNLDDINTELNRSIADVVSQINDKVSEISSLNIKIISTGGGDDGNKNDLLDKRSEALRELAAMVNISQLENPDGTVNVSMANGEPLLQGMTAQTLSIVLSGDKSDIFNSNSPEEVNSSITGGKLGAYMELQHSILPKYMNDLNELTNALATRVNALHGSGFDGNGNIGLDFFTITDTDIPSGSIGINPIIAADINRIAASASVSGDGENATRLASVRDELLMDDGKSSLSGFLAAMVGEIGRQTANAKTNSDHQSAIMNYLNNQRESVSGVSIDEEMILLIKYQMGYTTAGKLCQTVEEMLDTLMGLVR
jgi:flagellar hook-associated protein 1 FlgK